MNAFGTDGKEALSNAFHKTFTKLHAVHVPNFSLWLLNTDIDLLILQMG